MKLLLVLVAGSIGFFGCENKEKEKEAERVFVGVNDALRVAQANRAAIDALFDHLKIQGCVPDMVSLKIQHCYGKPPELKENTTTAETTEATKEKKVAK